MHINGITQKAYIAGNQDALTVWAAMNNFSSETWYTYIQAKSIGAQVKKGSKGIKLCFYGSKTITNEDGSKEQQSIRNSFVVFNKEQIDFNPIEIQQG